MKKFLSFAPLALLVVVLGSCSSLRPFTNNLKTTYNWQADELKKIQYYLSDDILLQRKLKNDNTEIVSGKVKTVNGEKIEEVVFKKGTPGVLVFSPVDNRMGIAFEDGDGRYLMFVPNPDRQGKYVLAAADWKNNVGKVNYDGRVFYCTPESGRAFLEIDMKNIAKIEKDTRKASGRKVAE